MLYARVFTVLWAGLFLIPIDAAGRQDPPAAASSAPSSSAQLKVFLDCENCFRDFLISEVAFADYVRDRTEADVHLIVTTADTGGGGDEYTLSFTGLGRFERTDRTLRVVTGPSETEDVIRRQLATAVRVGLLHYVAAGGVPRDLSVTVRMGTEESRPAVTGDRWNNWVFSLRGSAAVQGEESSRETQFGGSASADRITPDWKMTFGADFDQETEEFDIDEENPVKVERRERDFNWLIVKGLGEHWSAGATGEIESSTFDNTRLAIAAAPAVEYNVFPYSAYTRRQLRLLYAVGIERRNYYETTLFGKTEEWLPVHELGVAYEQRERWGSLEGEVEWTQFLHELDKTRLEAQGELSVRIVRGLSLAAQLNASRIRDQLSLPARGATPEEILLRLRRLQSGYEYQASFSLTYTFGSIFSSIVNPRFGR